ARKAGIRQHTSLSDSRMVMGALGKEEFSLVLLDYTMPYLAAVDLLPMITRDYPELPVIILTGRDQLETAVDCMRLGAADYFIKSHEEERLLTTLRRILSHQHQRQEVERLKHGLIGGELQQPEAFIDIIHESPSIKSFCHYIEAIAAGRRPVLIEGESGSGKELFAKALHRISALQGEWVTVNVAGMKEGQLVDVLFGHTAEGGDNGRRARRGLIEKAAGGTLFLDEIGFLNETCQLRLLRVLQEGQYYPLGSDRPRQSTARFVVSTSVDIRQHVTEGLFRKELYYRLQTHHMRLPALRDHADDIPVLLDYFLDLAATELGKKKPTPPAELILLLQSYHFPGNVRELRNMVFDAVSRHTSRKISMDSFRHAMGRTEKRVCSVIPEEGDRVAFGGQLPTIKRLITQLIHEALERGQGNQTVVAEMLGISRPALNKRLKNLREEGSCG
ncbi:MAG: sigma-54 dependent transcriptional regulator, partial [Geopsychrobacter sp.]|nr:sigma-54 dependent transcriptional regulator [Geopsychrobacter sp.]